jgi:DNA-binding GntR family transcriptional regulator
MRHPQTLTAIRYQLASNHDIATATVVKALRVLKDEGLIIGTTGHGTFVAERS